MLPTLKKIYAHWTVSRAIQSMTYSCKFFVSQSG